MPLVTLYRATDRVDSYGSGACFAADEEDAESYLDNPGFGGATLLSVEFRVDLSRVLSLVDGRRDGLPYGRQARHAWYDLAEALGLDAEDQDVIDELKEEGDSYLHGIVDKQRRRAQLHAAGYDWVVLEDSYPNGAVTWTYLGERVVL